MQKLKVTKTYQRYKLQSVFGIVSGDNAKACYVPTNLSDNKKCLCSAAENAVVWNLRTGEKCNVFGDESQNEHVSALAACLCNNSDSKIAVGYLNGWVYIFNGSTEALEAKFRAGRSKVSCMIFHDDMLICASDSEIHIFDIISSEGTRLKGHRGTITQLKMIANKNILLSSAQDGYIKFWELKTQHCFATLTGHPGTVWDFSLAQNNELLVSGTSDQQLRVWSLTHFDQTESENRNSNKSLANGTDSVVSEQDSFMISAEFLGCVQRSSNRRVHSLIFDSTGTYLFCQSFERKVEVFRLLNAEEKSKRLKKKLKKAKCKDSSIIDVKLEISDVLRSILIMNMNAKLNSIDVLSPKSFVQNGQQNHKIRFICSMKNNSVEEMELTIPANQFTSKTIQPLSKFSQKYPTVCVINKVSHSYHRSVPIFCTFTSDNLGLFTLSHTEAKLWSRKFSSCLITLDWKNLSLNSDNNVDTESNKSQSLPVRASAMAVAPGDRHIIVGFETGELYLFDLNLKSVIQTVDDAHKGGAVRSIAITGDKKGIVTGGSDKGVRFFNFELKLKANQPPVVCLLESKSSQTVSDPITCLTVSPDDRFVVIGLTNFHIDVFFSDSFKRVHSLYGHVGAITSLDICAESRLVISGSSDKTVRLWELQFGNCQRRFTSHLEPVTCVKFIPHTSLAVSSDLAGEIKQWDVKKFREITTFKGHKGSVNCLATTVTKPNSLFGKQSNSQKNKNKNKRTRIHEDHDENGGFVSDDDDDADDLCGGVILSVGQDFSIRVWSEAEELLILEEEEQMKREYQEEEEELIRSETIVPGAIPAEASETGPLGRPSRDTMDSADMLMEALDIYEEFSTKMDGNNNKKEEVVPHPLMIARGTNCPEKFLLKSLILMRSQNGRGGGAGLEHALGSLTTDYVRRLLPHLGNWLSRGWEVELVSRAIRHLVVLHFNLVMSNKELKEMIEESRQARLSQLVCLKNMVGMNLAGLTFLGKKIEETRNTTLFEEAFIERNKRISKQKAKQAKTAILLN